MMEFKMAKAIFGAGCFWGIEESFRKISGVLDVAVGYSGGATENPTYESICSGTTGHAEVVEIDFDDQKISFEGLLQVFWDCHDPTQLNYQGPDIGTQYRTAIFTIDEEQTTSALDSKRIEQASGKHRNDIATEITPAQKFWRAEEYHQQYISKNRGRFGRVFG
jgi:peptide-methionine (S)-S-oxide reductase